MMCSDSLSYKLGLGRAPIYLEELKSVSIVLGYECSENMRCTMMIQRLRVGLDCSLLVCHFVVH